MGAERKEEEGEGRDTIIIGRSCRTMEMIAAAWCGGKDIDAGRCASLMREAQASASAPCQHCSTLVPPPQDALAIGICQGMPWFEPMKTT